MRYNLLRYNSIASAVAVVVVTAILAVFYDRYATDSLVMSVEQQNVILAIYHKPNIFYDKSGGSSAGYDT